MARTAHHLPPSLGNSVPPDRAWRSVILFDLRYSSRSVAEAARDSRRVRPQVVRRVVDVYCFPRHNRDRSVARWSATEERRAWQRLRCQAGIARRLVNADTGAADDIDVLPANHRHGSLWLA
ncbi:hypothetical protein AB0H17_23595 [Streptomyces olivoreticuli]